MDRKDKDKMDYIIFDTHGFIVDKSDKTSLISSIGTLGDINSNIINTLKAISPINNEEVTIDIHFDKGKISLINSIDNKITIASCSK